MYDMIRFLYIYLYNFTLPWTVEYRTVD